MQVIEVADYFENCPLQTVQVTSRMIADAQ